MRLVVPAAVVCSLVCFQAGCRHVEQGDSTDAKTRGAHDTVGVDDTRGPSDTGTDTDADSDDRSDTIGDADSETETLLRTDDKYQWHTFFGYWDYEHLGIILEAGDWGADVAVDDAGNVYFAGFVVATFDGPDGEPPLQLCSGRQCQFTVVKVSPTGAYQWHTLFPMRSGRILVDSLENLYVAAGPTPVDYMGPGDTPAINRASYEDCTGTGCFALFKLDAEGTYQWHAIYGPGAVRGFERDGDDNLYTAGISYAPWTGPDGEVPLNSPGGEAETDIIFILKTGPDGTYRWHTFYGCPQNDTMDTWDDCNYVSDIAVAPDGNVYVAGDSRYDWMGPTGEAPLNPHSEGGVWESVLLKLDSRGNYAWHSFYGSEGDSVVGDIALSQAGNLYIVGTSRHDWSGPGDTPPLNRFAGWDDITGIKLTD